MRVSPAETGSKFSPIPRATYTFYTPNLSVVRYSYGVFDSAAVPCAELGWQCAGKPVLRTRPVRTDVLHSALQIGEVSV